VIARILGKRLAANIAIIILSLIIVFHLLVIFGIVPYSIVWGGRLTSKFQMIAFETISFIINLIIILLVLLRVGYIKTSRTNLTRISMWVIFGIFVLNTVGNLFSASSLERAIFTPLTLLLALLTGRLALKR
jgi:heme/copper-type cytochrome/quinol oxidase subunit 4